MIIHTEIAKRQWQLFCDAYSCQHEGWKVKIDRYEASGTILWNDRSSLKHPFSVGLLFKKIIFNENEPTPSVSIMFIHNGKILEQSLEYPAEIVTLLSDDGLKHGLLLYDRSGGLFQLRFLEQATLKLYDGWIELGANEKRIQRLTDYASVLFPARNSVDNPCR